MIKAFTAGFLLIALSELGDKTFFIAVILAMRHPRRSVFAGVLAALAVMTILSVLVGQAFSVLPKQYISYGEITLFLFFGFKLLYDATQMPANAGEAEVQAATVTVEEAEEELPQQPTWLTVGLEAFSLTFLAEWGDRTQIATIALAASNEPIGVILGAILGHGVCTTIAVLGGHALAGRISERIITAISSGLFILFGAIAFWEMQWGVF